MLIVQPDLLEKVKSADHLISKYSTFDINYVQLHFFPSEGRAAVGWWMFVSNL